VSYGDFKKCCKKKKEKKNMKKIRHISQEWLGGFSSNLELEVPHPERIHTEKFPAFLFRECQATDA